MTKRLYIALSKLPLRLGICLTASLAVASAHALSPDPGAAIDKLMRTLYQRGQFDGAILVARQGTILYRNAFGRANVRSGADFTPETPSDIGSLTKQFTAAAIMILAERKKVSYDDSITRYIPEFSRSAHLNQVTLRELLNHTSGMPDYDDLGMDDTRMSQDDLIAGLLKNENRLEEPGEKYRYSNPGYALLAVVVQRVSGLSFGDFLDREIFKPLAMNSTFLYDGPAKRSWKAAVGYNQFGDVDDSGPTSIPGDGGIFSTVDDLYKWDQALYSDKLLPQSALSEAFTPGRVRQGPMAYGFGWNVAEEDGNKYVWHQGNRGGFRAFIERRPTERLTVILLTNRGNSKRRDINAAIRNILAGKPYVLPLQSGAEKLYQVIHDAGIDTALQTYHALKNSNDSSYDFGESELNTLGYQLLYRDQRPKDAITIFALNAREHPLSSNTFDSLGEAYWRHGDTVRAIASYQTAVALDPSNGHAAEMLRKLRFSRLIPLVICAIGVGGISTLFVVFARRRIRRASR